MSDALGNPMGFYLTAGQLHDLQEADVWLNELKAEALLALPDYFYFYISQS
jgi:hypothetical protein